MKVRITKKDGNPFYEIGKLEYPPNWGKIVEVDSKIVEEYNQAYLAMIAVQEKLKFLYEQN